MKYIFLFFAILLILVFCRYNIKKKVFNFSNNLYFRKSQFNQDISLYYTFFQNKFNGFFIELGAYDGIRISNSYFFEKNFNWQGILIEGGENNCKSLKSNSIYRSNSIIICTAICKTKYVNYKDNGSLGSIVHSNASFYSHKCDTLRNITSYYNIKHIDLFSLDVEGSELEVIETFDFSVDVSHWLIEWNHLSKEVRGRIENILNKNGYYMENVYISPIDKVFSKKYLTK